MKLLFKLFDSSLYTIFYIILDVINVLDNLTELNPKKLQIKNFFNHFINKFFENDFIKNKFLTNYLVIILISFFSRTQITIKKQKSIFDDNYWDYHYFE